MDTCRITCAEFVSIIVINTAKFQLDNIDFYFSNNPNIYKIDVHTNISTVWSKIKYNASIIFYQCNSVLIANTEIVVNAGIVGLAAINVIGYSKIIQVTVKVNCSFCSTVNTFLMQINGIVLHYKEWDRHVQHFSDYRNMRNSITIDRFLYEIHGSCKNHSKYAIRLFFSQQSFNASFVYITNVIFNDIKNSSVSYFFMNNCSINLRSVLEIRNFIYIKLQEDTSGYISFT